MNRSGAMLISAIVGLLLVSPLFYTFDMLFHLATFGLMMSAIPVVMILGGPIHDILLTYTKAKYWQYAMAGAMASLIFCVAGAFLLGAVLNIVLISMFICWGVAMAVIFRWMVGYEIANSKRT